jgi:general secretion pathway protein H
MPTSVTGTSSSIPRLARAGYRASGFTLLEVLVVVVIIGIISSMAVVSIKVLGGDHEMDQEAARLAAVLGQAREDATLQGRDLGLRLDARGYDFLRYDSRTERWVAVSGDPLLRERSLPDGVGLELRLESREVLLKSRASPPEGQALSPQVVIQASGDLVPFEIVMTRDGTDEVRHVVGKADGQLTSGKVDDAAAR